MSAAPEPEVTGEKQDTRFKPGQSGNPKGRPKGTGTAALASALKAKLTDTEYAEWLLKVWRGEIVPTREQMWASEAVGDRVWGKAPAFAPIEGGDPLGIDGVERELDALSDELAARRKTKIASPAPKRAVAGASKNGKRR